MSDFSSLDPRKAEKLARSVENARTREKAKSLLHANLGTLLPMYAIIIAVAVVLMGLAIGCAAALLPKITIPPESESFWELLLLCLPMLVALVVSIPVSGLSLGLSSALLRVAKQETVGIRGLFSRMGQSFKAFGLMLWVALKTWLWMLPGMTVMLAGSGLILAADTLKDTPNDAQLVMTFVPFFIGYALMFALMIPAVLRYSLSFIALADDGSKGIRACVNRSKALMKGRKWQFFKLIAYVFLVMWLAMMGMSFIFAFLTGIFARSAAALIVVQVLMSVLLLCAMAYFSLRMMMTQILFYLNRCETQADCLRENITHDETEVPHE